MSRAIHPSSNESALEELSFFGAPCTQSSVEFNHEYAIKPAAPIHVSADILDFRISSEAGLYLDPRSIHILLEVQVVDDKGQAIADDAPVAPVNNFSHSLFQQEDVTINGHRISQPMKTYAYKAYYHTLFGYSPEAKENFLSCVLWAKDKDMSKPNMDRWPCKRSESFQVIVPLMSDIFMQPLYLPSNVNVEIKLYRSSRSFALHSTDTIKYGVNILDATLFYTKYKLEDVLFQSHLSTFKRGGTAKYPISYTEVKPIPINSGMSSVSIDNAYHGELPYQLVVAMVDEKAVNGDIGSNPFEFKHNNISNISITYNGRVYPGIPYRTNFEKQGHNMKAFYDMFKNSGQLRDNNPELAVNRADFRLGNCFFAFNFSADRSDASSGHMDLLKRGNARIDLEFGKKLENAIVLMMWAENNRLPEFDAFGNLISF